MNKLRALISNVNIEHDINFLPEIGLVSRPQENLGVRVRVRVRGRKLRIYPLSISQFFSRTFAFVDLG